MIIRLSLTLLLTFLGVTIPPARPNFSGHWQLDAARSTYKHSTKVLKDIPERLKAKIPNYDVLHSGLTPPTFFNEPPVVIIRHTGAQLSFSAPEWFKQWIPWEKVWLTDGKEKVEKFGAGSIKSSVRWEGSSIVRESRAEHASAFELSEQRSTFTISADGKTLTYDDHTTNLYRATVDGQVYEAEDSAVIHTVLVKNR